VAYAIAVVGTSWGGLGALRTLVAGLPASLALPIVIVQHRHRESGNLLAPLLQDHSALPVCEIEDKTSIEQGVVYVAPADYHVLIEGGFFSLTVDEPVRFSRPSIDLTFESAADAFSAAVIGVVLTGANADGARGLRRIADRGGLAIVQDPATAESPVMPRAALAATPSARVMRLEEIPAVLARESGPRQETDQPLATHKEPGATRSSSPQPPPSSPAPFPPPSSEASP
jgi:two-component system chemotaxis response regulator CheB